MSYAQLTDIIGKTLVSAIVDKSESEVRLSFSDGSVFEFFHSPDCCEHVYLHDIDGDWTDLYGSPILEATERTNSDDKMELEYEPESFTWTFYTIRTVKASITMRWLGESNGYYSESVELRRIN